MSQTPETPSLRTFDLATQGGRMAFLWTLWESYQEAGLLMAVNHLWDSLAAPRPLRARAMAASMALPGHGKQALWQVLSRFLHEANHDIAMDDLPPREAYPDFESWNLAAVAVFDRFHQQWSGIASRYEAVIDGREPSAPVASPPPSRPATLLRWPGSS